MTRTLLTAGAAAVLAVGLAGCGQAGSSAGSASSASDTASSATKTIASQLVMGGPPEFRTRPDGLPGLEKNYGVVFGKFIPTDVGGPVTVQALKSGRVDAADLFSTDPSIKANGFVVLTDPKSNFAAQNIVPIINRAKATDGVKAVLNGISAKLTTTGLSTMVGKVQNDKEDPDTVAKAWLSAQGLDASGTQAEGVAITVGSANFPENVVLADVYADALTAQGAKVKRTLNIGSREKYYPALAKGTLELFPEYTGTILQYIDKGATATSPDAVYAALQKALPSNLEALDRSEAQDTDSIVVTKATAEKYGLTSIADLAKPATS